MTLLFSKFTKSFGVIGAALNWLPSYLTDIDQVGIGTARS